MDGHSPIGITADNDAKREPLSAALPETEATLPQHDKPENAVIGENGEPLAGECKRAADELCQGRKRKRDDECGPQEAEDADTNHHMSFVHSMDAGTDGAPPLAEPSPPSPPGAPPSQVETPAATSVSPRPPTRQLSMQLPLPFPGAPQAVMMPPMFMPALCQLLLVYIQRAQLLAAPPAGEQEQGQSSPQQQSQLLEPPPSPPLPTASAQAPPEGQAPPQPPAQQRSPPPENDGGAKPLVKLVVPPAVVAVRQLQAFNVSAQLLLQASAHLMVVGALAPLDYQAIQTELGFPALQLPFPMGSMAATGPGATVGAAAVAAAEGLGAGAVQGAVGAPRAAAHAASGPSALSLPAAVPMGPGLARPLSAALSLAPAAVATITSALASRGSAGTRFGSNPPASGAAAGTAAAAGLPPAGPAGLAPASGQGPSPLGPSAAAEPATGARADGGAGGNTAAAAGDAAGVGQKDAPVLASAPSWAGRGAGPSGQRLGLGRRLFKAIAEQLPTNAELDSVIPPINGLFSGVMYKVQGSTEVGCAMWDGAQLRDLGLYSTPQDARQSLSISIKLVCAGAAVTLPAAPPRARPAAAKRTYNNKLEQQQQQQPPAGVEPGVDVVAAAAATVAAQVAEGEAAAAPGGIPPKVGTAGAGLVPLDPSPGADEGTADAAGSAAGAGPMPAGPPVSLGSEADLMDAAEQLLLLRQDGLPRPDGLQEPQAQDFRGPGSGPGKGPAPAPAGPGGEGALPDQTQGLALQQQQPSAVPRLTQQQLQQWLTQQQLQQWLSQQQGARLQRREEQEQLLQLLLRHQQQQQLAKLSGSNSAEQQRATAAAPQPPQPDRASSPGLDRTTAAAAAAALAAQVPNGNAQEPGRAAAAIGMVEDVAAGANVPAAPRNTPPAHAPAGAGAGAAVVVAGAAVVVGGGGGAAALVGGGGGGAAAAVLAGTATTGAAGRVSAAGADAVAGVAGGMGPAAITTATATAAGALQPAAASADGLPSASKIRHHVRQVRQPAEPQGPGCAAEPAWRPHAGIDGPIRVAASSTDLQPSTGVGTAANTASTAAAAGTAVASLADGVAVDTRSGSDGRPACARGLLSSLDRETQLLLLGLLPRAQPDRGLLLSLLASSGGVSAPLGTVQQQEHRQSRQTGLDPVVDPGAPSAPVVLETAGSGPANMTPRGWSGSGEPAAGEGPRCSPPREAVAPRRRPQDPEPWAVGTQHQHQHVLLLDRSLLQEALLGPGLGMGPAEDVPPACLELPDRMLRLGEQHHLNQQKQQQEQQRLQQRLQRQQQQQRQQHPQLMEAGSDSEVSGRVLVLGRSRSPAPGQNDDPLELLAHSRIGGGGGRNIQLAAIASARPDVRGGRGVASAGGAGVAGLRAAELLVREEEVLAAVIAGGGIQDLPRSLAAQQAGARLAAAAVSAGQSRAEAHQALGYLRLGSGGGGVSANAISSNAHTVAQPSFRGATLVLSGPNGAESAATSGMSWYGENGPAAAMMPREACPSGRVLAATPMAISDDAGDGDAQLPLGPLHAQRQLPAAQVVRHSVVAAAAARSAASGRMSARKLNLEVRGYGQQYTSHAAAATTGGGSSDMDMGAGVYGSATVAAAEAAALLSSGLAPSLPSCPASYARSVGLNQGYGHGHDVENSIAYGRVLDASLDDRTELAPARRGGDRLTTAVGGVAMGAAGSDSSKSNGAVRAASDAAEVQARAEPTRGIRQAGVSREYAAVTSLVGLGLQEALALVRQRQGGPL